MTPRRSRRWPLRCHAHTAIRTEATAIAASARATDVLGHPDHDGQRHTDRPDNPATGKVSIP